MASTQALCNSFKKDILDGVHLPAHVYKMAIYSSAAAMDKTTTTYSATNEASGAGYTAGGVVLTGRTSALTGDVGNVTWASFSISNASITGRYGLIYNDTLAGKNAVAVVDFGADITSTNGPFAVTMPASGASALVRVG